MKKLLIPMIISTIISCKKTEDTQQCDPYPNMILQKTETFKVNDTILYKDWKEKYIQLRWKQTCGAEKYVVYVGEIRDDNYGRHANYPLDTTTNIEHQFLIKQNMINENLNFVLYDWAIIALRNGSIPVSSDTSYFVLKMK